MNWSTKLRVVIDTNIFISGLNWGGNPKMILDQWLCHKFDLLLSPYLASEIVSTYQDFKQPTDNIKQLKLYLETKTIKVVPTKKVTICRDKKDKQILDLCLFGKADFLITGDKDLLALKKFEKTSIVKPKEFLKLSKIME
jgi:putative PIN family toxin of toxin-antitoxin system